MGAHLDCVVVGYNDVSIAELVEQAAVYKDFSGTYRHLLANTVPLNGRRVKYPALFNHSLALATGKPASYNVAKVPNLGACYLASFLGRRGLSAEVVNFFNDDKDLLAQLLDESPSTVAITTTYYFDAGPVREIVDFVRSRNSDTKIVVGGPHIFNICTDFPEGGAGRRTGHRCDDLRIGARLALCAAGRGPEIGRGHQRDKLKRWLQNACTERFRPALDR